MLLNTGKLGNFFLEIRHRMLFRSTVKKEQIEFWVQVYTEKNSQNVKMERISAGSLWDVNDDTMKAQIIVSKVPIKHLH
jgi:hypothetical protein